MKPCNIPDFTPLLRGAYKLDSHSKKREPRRAFGVTMAADNQVVTGAIEPFEALLLET